MEKRIRLKDEPKKYLQGQDLPVDFLKMVNDVFDKNFGEGLKSLGKYLKNPQFIVSGKIYSDELVFAVTIISDKEIAATTVYASCDFDPKASVPNASDRLGDCVDAIGEIMAHLLDTENEEGIKALASRTMNDVENVPFEWTVTEAGKRKVHVKVDKSNPTLDKMADDWLSKHDPQYEDAGDAESEAVKALSKALREDDDEVPNKKLN